MRYPSALIVVACLSIPTSALGQDAFAGVPNEPRPSEYLHWDAEAFVLRRGLRVRAAARPMNWRCGSGRPQSRSRNPGHDLSPAPTVVIVVTGVGQAIARSDDVFHRNREESPGSCGRVPGNAWGT